jgi:hypothetical protein
VPDNVVAMGVCKYAPAELTDFIGLMFHARPVDGAVVFAQLSKSAPRGFGKPAEEVLIPRLRKATAPMKGYFSTSMLRPQEDGTLRHSREAFASFHVLVLDDIGTKIPWTKLPEALVSKANANIETSPGNHQLMFTLAEPITDYEEAQLLIDLFVDAGLTDGGGAMPVKKVRLPCGVNGKKSADKALFRVKLISTSPDPWDIPKLLAAAGIDVDWEQHRLNAHRPSARYRRLGTSAYRADQRAVSAWTGAFDPVLEFLHSRGEVIQDSEAGFMDIICPFHAQHSGTGLEDKLCGYSPLGHGRYPQSRKFHCFHDHCKDRTHEDFLDEIHALGGPLVPARAPSLAASFQELVFVDGLRDCIFHAPAGAQPLQKVLSSMLRTISKVKLPDGSKANPLSAAIATGEVLRVDGVRRDPTTDDRILTVGEGDTTRRYLNTYSPPGWPVLASPKLDQSVWNFFARYVGYLIPSKREREYFLDWLALLVQDNKYRGPLMVMVAKQQGVGRGRLFRMIRMLWRYEENSEVIQPDAIHATNDSRAFNPWRKARFAMCNESLTDHSQIDRKQFYEAMKSCHEPGEDTITINEKNIRQYSAVTNTAILLASNHENALWLPSDQDSRRVYVITNPSTRGSLDYFSEVTAWIDSGLPEGSRPYHWQTHLWNFLRNRKVDAAAMYGPAPCTPGRKSMVAASGHTSELIADAVITCWDHPYYLPTHHYQEFAERLMKHFAPHLAQHTGALPALGIAVRNGITRHTGPGVPRKIPGHGSIRVRPWRGTTCTAARGPERIRLLADVGDLLGLGQNTISTALGVLNGASTLPADMPKKEAKAETEETKAEAAAAKAARDAMTPAERAEASRERLLEKHRATHAMHSYVVRVCQRMLDHGYSG